MRIGIDARLSGSKHAGIGRYTQHLIQELLKKRSQHTYVCFFYDAEQAEEVLQSKISSKQVEIRYTPVKHYTFAEQKQMLKAFHLAKLDLLHVPHFNIPVLYSGKLVVTIHDLLWHEYRGGSVTTLNPVMYLLKYLFYRLVTRIAVSKAERIIVPAETIRETVIKYYPSTAQKIVVTKEGAQIAPKATSKDIKKRKKTLLYVGSLYPHKNIKLVLQALPGLKNYKLLIAGSRSVFRDKIEEYVKYKDISDQVEFLGYVTDEELANLYQSVSALVQPSFSEGFGLTGVEAMSFGASVLASDIPIFREIYKDVAYYFSPHSTASFIQAVHAMEESSEEKNTEGIALAQTYSWKKMAAATLDVYETL